MAEKVKGHLATMSSSNVHVASIEGLAVVITPASTVLSLTELDGRVFENITPSRLEASETVCRQARNVLWVERGARTEAPHSFMAIGLDRVI